MALSGEELKRVCEEAGQAVRQAGEIIRERWDRPREITRKGRIDLVTDTDVAVEETLKKSLAQVLPKATFLAEESSGKAELADLTWVIDPLDGTTNFAHALPFVAISVGLWDSGRVRAGIVYNPILQEYFYAAEGQGAWYNDARASVSEASELEQCVVATGFPYTIQDEVDAVMARLREVVVVAQGIRRCGAAALDLAYVACGKLGAYYEACLNPWDMAAGSLLVSEAGGRVSDFDSSPLDLRSGRILASNGQVHGQMSGLLQAAARRLTS